MTDNPFHKVLQFIRDALDSPNPPTDEEITAALNAKGDWGNSYTVEEVRAIHDLHDELLDKALRELQKKKR
jgi:hypothetical protein